MERTKQVLFNSVFFLNCALVFLALVDERLSIPAWLQVAGRMHPMVLHFPIVLIILTAIATLFVSLYRREAIPAHISDMLLLITASMATITALSGLFLSREDGYDPEVLSWHKWSGVIIALFMMLWYMLRKWLYASKAIGISFSAVAVMLVFATGHQGAGITHGANFIFAPLTVEEKIVPVSMEQALVYDHIVQPILESKCYSCHNVKKAKGELVMETEALLLKGGKSGALWDPGAGDLGLMLRRVHLPLQDKKHMPPMGKPQLTDEEIEILTHWIRKGADFRLRVAELEDGDTLKLLAATRLGPTSEAAYNFAAADATTVKKLNTVNRVVAEEALSSLGLNVSFFNAQLYRPEHLQELSAIKQQVVSLDLAKMPVTDADLGFISSFENLRRLNLNFTNITGATLGELKKLKHLHTLALSGTKVEANALRTVQSFPKLKTLYAWNIAVPEAEMSRIIAGSKRVKIETGSAGDTSRLKLSPPVLKNEEMVLIAAQPLLLKHYINGAEIRYTLDGTEPDSIKANVFTGKETIDGNVHLRAKAYKAGWTSSDEIEATFYKSGYRPDSLIFITPPDPGYAPDSKLLVDLVKGETNFRNGNWLAWRAKRMEVLLPFHEPVKLSSVTLSLLLDIGSYIFPPASVEVWGGDDPAKLTLLGKIKPLQPTRMQPATLRGVECKFAPASVKYLRIVANPVASLPGWHPGKGDKAWIFVDELILN